MISVTGVGLGTMLVASWVLPIAPVGLGVSRSHSMALFRLFGYPVARC